MHYHCKCSFDSSHPQQARQHRRAASHPHPDSTGAPRPTPAHSRATARRAQRVPPPPTVPGSTNTTADTAGPPPVMTCGCTAQLSSGQLEGARVQFSRLQCTSHRTAPPPPPPQTPPTLARQPLAWKVVPYSANTGAQLMTGLDRNQKGGLYSSLRYSAPVRERVRGICRGLVAWCVPVIPPKARSGQPAAGMFCAAETRRK
jgi:hypothetical protein